MGERLLNPNQKAALEFIARALKEGDSPLVINKGPLGEAFGLSPQETEEACAVLGLIWHYISKRSGGEGINPKLKRGLAATLINNSPGSRQMREEKQGKSHIPKGHFPTGRNYGGRVKATR